MALRQFSVKKTSGVTLLEMMIVVVIMGLLASLAVPAYRFMIQNHRATVMTEEFANAIALTRNIALTSSASVSICAAADASLTACGTSANWNNGWIIFADPNADGVIANQGDIERVHEGFPAGSTVTTTLARITYAGSGFLNSLSGTFALTSAGCSGNHGRLITLSTTGRPAITSVSC